VVVEVVEKMGNFDFFNAIFCINLDSRLDRWNQCLVEFDKAGIRGKVIRVPGVVVKNNPCHGNHMAHAKCLEIAENNKLQNCLILEDDVEFFDDTFTTLGYCIKDIPENWDIFYLGANVWAPALQISPHIAKLTAAFATHAYAVKYTMYDILIDINTNKSIAHNDVEYSQRIIPNFNCYVSYPLICGQRNSYSDIMGREMSSNAMFKERLENSLIRL
jgi:hypothetical protein